MAAGEGRTTKIPLHDDAGWLHCVEAGVSFQDRIYDIYVITHVPTGREYVGCTIHGAQARWNQHVGARHVSPGFLHQAMRQFGIDQFVVAVITQVHERDNPHARERAEMCARNSFWPNGFNKHQWTLASKEERAASVYGNPTRTMVRRPKKQNLQFIDAGQSIFGKSGWQRQLAYALDVNETTISAYANGFRAIPKHVDLALEALLNRKKAA